MGESRPPARMPVKVLQAAVVMGLVAYTASTVARPTNSYSPLFDSWVGNFVYAGSTVLCAWRAISRRSRRTAWLVIALALGVFTVGSILWTTTVQFWDPVPYPSPADFAFLLFYPIACLGIGLLMRNDLPRSSRMWLDGLIAAVGFSAIGATVVLGPIVDGTTGDHAAVITNLAYPIGDLVLVTMLVGYFTMRNWRVEGLWWALGGGFALFAVADSLYVWRVVKGAYVTGTPLDATWMIASVVVALAAWRGRTTSVVGTSRTNHMVLPAVFLLSSLAIVVYGTAKDVVPIGIVLASATLLLAILRSAASFRQLRSLAESRREARTDELTGLSNRRPFYEAINAWAAASDREEAAVLMIDLARFKEINDSLGHQVGDEVLRQVGQRLGTTLRERDTVARLGGDEFGIVLRDVRSRAGAIEVAERVRALLTESFVVGAVSVRIDAGLGLALGPEHGEDAETLVHKADVAMYESKRRHLPWAVYSERWHVDTGDRLALVEELRDAIARDELVVHYQPKLDLRTGRAVGVEALVRWPHETRGMLAADVFIELADQTGLMGGLTRLFFDKAIAQLAAWRSEGIDISIAINLSVSNLLDTQLPTAVASALQRHGVPADAVILEITEHSLMFDPQEAKAVMHRLRNLGCELSVDDYGTGFSSLAYLRDLPVGELKLDRSFLADVTKDERAVAIVKSTVELAHSLGLRMVAEGVETPSMLSTLFGLGCDQAQGYHIARPMAAEELTSLLRVKHDIAVAS